MPKKDMKENFQKLISKLENMILTGAFQPRERLVELQLAEQIGVSRFWIRDAFKILETRGLIKVIPYKGALVSDLDEHAIEEIFEVRVALEALATRKAAENIRKEDIKVLKRMADYVEESFRRTDYVEMVSANGAFHDFILELSRNQTLINMINQLKGRCHILRHFAWSSKEIVRRILGEHRLFIKGLEGKDFQLLDDLARRHISYSKDFYLLQLKAKKAAFSNNIKS